ncbi:MAG TPA: helix-turn-helix transcriptional regulator [Actinomycetota bacterium]|jgi:DNA-binding NarL/FixJ family response regulator
MRDLRVGVVKGDEILSRGLVAALNEDDSFKVFVLEPDESPEVELDVAVVSSGAASVALPTCPVIIICEDDADCGQDVSHRMDVAGAFRRQGLTAERLTAAVRAAAAGLHVDSHGEGERTAKLLDVRRLEVLRLLADGADTRTIASKLRCSERTIKNLIHDVVLKLEVANRAQAVAEGVRRGLI